MKEKTISEELEDLGIEHESDPSQLGKRHVLKYRGEVIGHAYAGEAAALVRCIKEIMGAV